MTAPTAKQWGMTPAISTTLPTTQDNAQNAALIEELKKQNNYEHIDDTKKRQETLQLLFKITIEFVRQVSLKRGYPESQVSQFGGKIFAYGSYRLGVFGPGSDIDTLVVAPRHVKRNDFFELYPDILKRMAPEGGLGQMTPVPDSFVPIIKLELNNIDIDLIFVSIETQHTIPASLELKDNALLDKLDQAGIKSITGPRVTDEILSLVPQQKTFRTALRAIKLWAQRRAVYANILGFPGGVAWAMLVARVCQLYPAATGATVVSKFFYIIMNWKWPQPILLKPIETGKEKTWNPALYTGDRKNIMPIITPAYPSMCATYNISKSGKAMILKELKRGHEIVTNIFEAKATWHDLFTKHTFFTKDHKYYLSVIASSSDEDAAKAWAGLVESKVRHLIMQLENQADMIELARPYIKGYKRIHKCANEEQLKKVKLGSTDFQVSETETTESNVPQIAVESQEAPVVPEASSDAHPAETASGFPKTLHTTTFYIGIDLTPAATKNLNISSGITVFKQLCQSWPQWQEGVQDLTVHPCKSYELPLDVFDKEKGEERPTKPPRRRAQVNGSGRPAVAAPPVTVKRNVNQVDEPTTNGTAKRHASEASMSAVPTPTPT